MEQEPNQKGAALEVYDKLATGASTIRQRSSDTAKIDLGRSFKGKDA